RFSGRPTGEWQDMTPSERGNKSMICCRGPEARDLKRIYNEIYLRKILGEYGTKEFHCCKCKGLMDIHELRNCKREGEDPRITYACEVCENGKETWYDINKWEIVRHVQKMGIKNNWSWKCGCNPRSIETHFGGNERTTRQHCCKCKTIAKEDKLTFRLCGKAKFQTCEDSENEEKLELGEEIPEEWERQKVVICDVCQGKFPRRRKQGGYSHEKNICDLECQVALAAATEAVRYTEIREEVRRRTEGTGKRFRNTREYSNNKTGIVRLAGLYFRKYREGELITDEQLRQAKEPREEDEWTHTGRGWTLEEEIRLNNIMRQMDESEPTEEFTQEMEQMERIIEETFHYEGERKKFKMDIKMGFCKECLMPRNEGKEYCEDCEIEYQEQEKGKGKETP
ncbi:19222_t:CDS:2, partial [Dentiscutata erythropus]